MPPCLKNAYWAPQYGSLQLRKRSGGGGIVANSPWRENTPAYQPVGRRVSPHRGNFAFAPLPSDRHAARVHHRASPRLRPDVCAACQILGAFFRSKFLFQSLPRLPVPRVFVGFTWRVAFGFSAATHSFTGKYRSPWRTASDPSSRCSPGTLPLRKPVLIAWRSIWYNFPSHRKV